MELLNPLSGTPSGVVVTDLAGNTLWTYANPATNAQNYVNGVKMLANGDFLMAIGMGVPYSAIPADAVNEVREVNLAGDTVRKVTVNDVNAALALASCAECHVTLETFHHDLEPLANGHVEYDLCGVSLPVPSSPVFEVTQDTSAETVWSMQVTGTYLYRASRMGSMYPGIQW